jgi:hypothetical protein
VSIETAKLFLTYIDYDTANYNVTAASIAAFRHHPNVTPEDVLEVWLSACALARESDRRPCVLLG